MASVPERLQWLVRKGYTIEGATYRDDESVTVVTPAKWSAGVLILTIQPDGGYHRAR